MSLATSWLLLVSRIHNKRVDAYNAGFHDRLQAVCQFIYDMLVTAMSAGKLAFFWWDLDAEHDDGSLGAASIHPSCASACPL